MPDLFTHTGATFSACRSWRYRLWRRWSDGPAAVLLAMNPSKADEVDNDPTIERWVRRALKWNAMPAATRINGAVLPDWLCMVAAEGGFGSAEVVNAFAWRETDSRKLKAHVDAGVDIVGPENDTAIIEACRSAGIVICGWGKPGRLLGRDARVLELLRSAGVRPYAFGINTDGTPLHPLYVGYDVQPIPYALPAAA